MVPPRVADVDGLIFVALAVAWAIYLVPKALKHHDEVVRSRPVDSFSDQVRVVARRDATADAESELVVTRRRGRRHPETKLPGNGPSVEEFSVEEPVAERPTEVESGSNRRFASARLKLSATLSREARRGALPERAPRSPKRPTAPMSPARRRRRVLGVMLGLLVATAVPAGLGVVSIWWVAVPVALLGGWLIACRLMVRAERARPARRQRPPSGSTLAIDETLSAQADDLPDEPAVAAPQPAVPGGWDLRPMTLPTYVDKAPAERRAAPELDPDSTGVWSSGRSEIDSQIARAAEAEAAVAKEQEQARRRRSSGA